MKINEVIKGGKENYKIETIFDKNERGGNGVVGICLGIKTNKKFFFKKFESIAKSTPKNKKERFVNHQNKIIQIFNELNKTEIHGFPDTIDFFIDNETYHYWKIMEYYEGQNLKNLIKENPDYSKIFDWIGQLLFLISKMHSYKIAHCDLKPENIFIHVIGESSEKKEILQIIDNEDVIYLGDRPPDTMIYHGFTGTELWYSPEHAALENDLFKITEITTKIDIFTISAIIQYLITKGKPKNFEGRYPIGWVEYFTINKKIPETFSYFKEYLPKSWKHENWKKFCKMIDKGFDFDVSKRPSANDLREAFINAKNGDSDLSSISPPLDVPHISHKISHKSIKYSSSPPSPPASPSPSPVSPPSPPASPSTSKILNFNINDKKTFFFKMEKNILILNKIFWKHDCMDLIPKSCQELNLGTISYYSGKDIIQVSSQFLKEKVIITRNGTGAFNISGTRIELNFM